MAFRIVKFPEVIKSYEEIKKYCEGNNLKPCHVQDMILFYERSIFDKNRETYKNNKYIINTKFNSLVFYGLDGDFFENRYKDYCIRTNISLGRYETSFQGVYNCNYIIARI